MELVATLDGEPFTLKREQEENWVKKRGQGDAVYSGNVSKYYINGVERKASDFKAAITDICSEDVFGYIATLSAFNNADNKTRRSILLSMLDGNLDAELLALPEFADMASEMHERGVNADELKKLLNDRLRLQKNDLKMLPVRIDEAKHMIRPEDTTDAAVVQKIVEESQARIKQIDAQILDVMRSDPSADVSAKIVDLKKRMADRKNDLSAKFLQNRCLWNGKIADANRKLSEAKADMESYRKASESSIEQIKSQTALRDKLRKDYMDAAHLTFVPPETDGICPTCKQPLPMEMQQEALQKAKADFDLKRAEELSSIQTRGKEVAAFLTALEANREDALKKVAMKQGDMEKAEALVKELEANPPVPDDEAKDALLQSMDQELQSLQVLKLSADVPDVSDLQAERAELMQKVDKAKEALSRAATVQEAKARVAELEQKHRALGDATADTEKKIMQVEAFIRKRCELLENDISENFESIRWKLFDQQINGGLAETCGCMVRCGTGYVPYYTANTASQLIADLEIIDTLSKRYNVSLPIFFDNRERVNVLPPVEGQLITLAVTTDEELKVEIIK